MHQEDPPRHDHIPPLQEPAWFIFIYAAWALVSWYLSPWLGLLVLVAATTSLTVAAFRDDTAPTAVAFVADFNVALLYCAAAIAVAVLVLEAMGRASMLMLAGLLYAAAGAIVVGYRRIVHAES